MYYVTFKTTVSIAEHQGGIILYVASTFICNNQWLNEQ